jgi:hypothetical protein
MTMKSVAMAVCSALCLSLLIVPPVSAHSPICNCYRNEDQTITCEGGFTDGSSAEGVAIRIADLRERVLIEGKMGDDSTFSFTPPDAEFHVVFDAGESHIVTIYSEDIE